MGTVADGGGGDQIGEGFVLAASFSEKGFRAALGVS
jgi:hypothetical protein